MHARSESMTAALPIFVNQRLGERGRRPAWVGPSCSRNPHDETVVVRRAQVVTKPGQRVYYTKHGREVVVLLAGGDKCTQATDINMLQSSRESQVPSQATTLYLLCINRLEHEARPSNSLGRGSLEKLLRF